PCLLLPLAPVAPILRSTGDLNSALAAFLAVGITAVGALAVGWRWSPSYLLVGSGVALVLQLAPDNFATFGLLLLLVEIGATARLIRRHLGTGLRRRTLQPAIA